MLINHVSKNLNLKAFIFSILVVLLVLTPNLANKKFNPTQQIIGDGGDDYQFFSFMHFAKQNVIALKPPFSHITQLRYPVGVDFTATSDGALAILLGMVLSFVFSEIVAFNLVVFFILVFNVFVSIVFFRKLSRLLEKDLPEINFYLSGVLFGLSPYVMARLGGHLNLATVAGFPVFAYALIRLYKKLQNYSLGLTFIDYLAPFAGLLFVMGGSIQYFVILLYVLLILFVFVPLFFPSTIKEVFGYIEVLLFTKPLYLFISLGVFTTTFWFIWRGYVLNSMSDGPIRLGFFTLSSGALFWPGAYLGEHWGVLKFTPYAIETIITPGFIAVLILMLFVLKNPGKRGTYYLILIIASVWMLSLGYITTPAALYSRWSVLAVFIIALLPSISDLFTKKIAKFILVLAIVERIFYFIHVSPPFPYAFFKVIQKQPGAAVFTMPMYHDVFGQFKNLIPVFTDKSTIEGYFHYVADTKKSRVYIAKPPFVYFDCTNSAYKLTENTYTLENIQQILSDMKMLNTYTIIVFRDVLDIPECTAVKELWSFILLNNQNNLLVEKVQTGVNVDTYAIK